MSTLYPTTAELRAKLAAARTELAAAAPATEQISAANQRTYGNDPAIASGVRRKSSARADARRYGAYDREATAYARHAAAEKSVQQLEQQLARAERNAPVPFTEEQWKAAQVVRTRDGWKKVVRVNVKTVTVAVPPGWDDKVTRARVLEVR